MNPVYQHVISIHGAPRSGTSWLGQIFRSHSDVAYRFQPLFSYRFKDRIGTASSDDEIHKFLKELYEVTEDAFILGDWRKELEPQISDAKKADHPSWLVWKEVRYHHLIEKFLLAVRDQKVVGIIRNPCAVINSWLQAPKEFKQEWDVQSEWRYAPAKNQGRIEEYNGFEKWKELSLLFLELQRRYPDRFIFIQYEDLVTQPVQQVEMLFSFLNLHMEQQVIDFINASQSRHVDDAYSVFKSPLVKDKWRSELHPHIIAEITHDLLGTTLERFLK